MRLLWMLPVLALFGCDRASPYAGWSQQETAGMADLANANARTALAQIEELKQQVAELEEHNERQDRLINALGASLSEARQNHDSLRETFNGNVDKSNDRNDQFADQIRWLSAQHGVYQ